MAFVSTNNTVIPSVLMQILSAEDIQPGSQAGYDTCKNLWIYHPLGGKLVEKPIRMAQSKPRKLAMDCHPKEMLLKAYQEEWDRIGATEHIRDTMFISRAYGV